VTFRIEPARERDVPLILSLIKGLAEYEKLAHEVVATEERLRQSLFGPHPSAEVVIAYVDDEAVGFALFFHTYSTYARGGDLLIGTYNYLDLTPLGRQEGWGGTEDLNQQGDMWVRHHDNYGVK